MNENELLKRNNIDCDIKTVTAVSTNKPDKKFHTRRGTFKISGIIECHDAAIDKIIDDIINGVEKRGGTISCIFRTVRG